MILIITTQNDHHTDRVANALAKRGEDYACLCPSRFPQHIGGTLRFNNEGGAHTITIDGREIELGSVTSVWLRRLAPPEPATDMSEEDQNFVGRESRHFLRALWALLKDRFWVNDVDNERCASWKPFQLRMAEAVGLKIPKTVITNDPDVVVRFARQCSGDLVYKCLTHCGRLTETSVMGLFTRRITAHQVEAEAHRFQIGPGILQEYVAKRAELRITVIGAELFVAQLDSQAHSETCDDWRVASHLNISVPCSQGSVPDHVAVGIRQLMARLGLVFGCIDMIVTPTGEFVFLEINPAGQWSWIEDLTGFPLADRLADLLIGRGQVAAGRGV